MVGVMEAGSNRFQYRIGRHSAYTNVDFEIHEKRCGKFIRLGLKD
jgi:hypothetical protein